MSVEGRVSGPRLRFSKKFCSWWVGTGLVGHKCQVRLWFWSTVDQGLKHREPDEPRAGM